MQSRRERERKKKKKCYAQKYLDERRTPRSISISFNFSPFTTANKTQYLVQIDKLVDACWYCWYTIAITYYFTLAFALDDVVVAVLHIFKFIFSLFSVFFCCLLHLCTFPFSVSILRFLVASTGTDRLQLCKVSLWFRINRKLHREQNLTIWSSMAWKQCKLMLNRTNDRPILSLSLSHSQRATNLLYYHHCYPSRARKSMKYNVFFFLLLRNHHLLGFLFLLSFLQAILVAFLCQGILIYLLRKSVRERAKQEWIIKRSNSIFPTKVLVIRQLQYAFSTKWIFKKGIIFRINNVSNPRTHIYTILLVGNANAMVQK